MGKKNKRKHSNDIESDYTPPASNDPIQAYLQRNTSGQGQSEQLPIVRPGTKLMSVRVDGAPVRYQSPEKEHRHTGRNIIIGLVALGALGVGGKSGFDFFQAQEQRDAEQLARTGVVAEPWPLESDTPEPTPSDTTEPSAPPSPSVSPSETTEPSSSPSNDDATTDGADSDGASRGNRKTNITKEPTTFTTDVVTVARLDYTAAELGTLAKEYKNDLGADIIAIQSLQTRKQFETVADALGDDFASFPARWDKNSLPSRLPIFYSTELFKKVDQGHVKVPGKDDINKDELSAAFPYVVLREHKSGQDVLAMNAQYGGKETPRVARKSEIFDEAGVEKRKVTSNRVRTKIDDLRAGLAKTATTILAGDFSRFIPGIDPAVDQFNLLNKSDEVEDIQHLVAEDTSVSNKYPHRRNIYVSDNDKVTVASTTLHGPRFDQRGTSGLYAKLKIAYQPKEQDEPNADAENE